MSRSFAVVGVILAACAASACSAQSSPAVQEQAQVPEKDGMTDVTVFKVHKRMDTVTCRDFNLVDENFRPQAVVYAANYGPKGKPHPTMTVDGVESVVPVVVDNCRVRPGDHFVTAVHRAMMQEKAGMKKPGK